ncbi:VCBS repeat-containing protein [Candidatus Bipolaricaulota bacterium]|nr:VCBS repeat-containing protein [Candidatus Bipolaricaulota bacterium]
MNRLVAILCLMLACAAAANGQNEPAPVTFAEMAGYGDANTFQVALGDFDGDGDLDAFFGNMDVEAELWWNNGDGTFRNSYQHFRHAVHGVGVGDLDGDGDLDLFLVRASKDVPSSIYLNDGGGQFYLGEDLDDVGLGAGFLTLFDLEGDGDLDASVYRAPQSSTLHINDGNAHFARLAQTAPGLANWGDVDGDGDADAVIEVAGSGYFTWINHGHASFVRSQEISVPSPFFAGGATLADLDADGDLDLIGCSAGFDEELPMTVLLNNGDGVFTYVPEDRFLTVSGWISLGDVNGDGVLDVLASAPDRLDKVGLGDGFGGFIDSGLRIGTRRMPGMSALGDIDGDGDIDIMLCQYDPVGPNTVWMNISE